MSRDEFDKTIPVTPPIVNRQINPRAHRRGVSSLSVLVPWIVASHLKTLIPVGMAMIMVAAVK